jgi:hypothetical protein
MAAWELCENSKNSHMRAVRKQQKWPRGSCAKTAKMATWELCENSKNGRMGAVRKQQKFQTRSRSGSETVPNEV